MKVGVGVGVYAVGVEELQLLLEGRALRRKGGRARLRHADDAVLHALLAQRVGLLLRHADAGLRFPGQITDLVKR